jgi:hypothetical protein
MSVLDCKTQTKIIKLDLKECHDIAKQSEKKLIESQAQQMLMLNALRLHGLSVT